MAEIVKSKALILRSIRWQESSKIVNIYSSKWGRLGLIAKGALRPRSSFAGNLETLNYVECIISKKEGRDLQILTGINVINSFNQMRLDLNQLPYALALLEVLDQVLEGHTADSVFFDFTIHIIESIQNSSRPATVFWYFLLKLASFLGFRPQLQRCHICSKEKQESSVHFNLHQGTIYCADCYTNSTGGGIKLNQAAWYFLKQLQTYPHKKILEFAENPETDLKLTPMLIQYLNIHLDKDISVKSLQLLI